MKSDFDLAFQNENIESKIIAALERISQAFRVLLWQESKDFSLSPIQVQVLIFLLHHSEEKSTVSYLANEFNMTKATISDTIKSLEEKQLIKKTTQQHDTRSYTIHLTVKGKNIALKTSLFSKEIKTPIDKLHGDDKENLLFSLMNIIGHLNQSGVITIQRMCFNCTYYQSSANGQKHFCKLINQQLPATELRLDCTEHEIA
jgi:DNA-binding MarR family transcriptional regulator